MATTSKRETISVMQTRESRSRWGVCSSAPVPSSEVSIKASLGKLEAAEGWAEELLAEGFSLLSARSPTPLHIAAFLM
jgi:hypothetical protein